MAVVHAMTASRLEERARTVSNRQILLIAVAFGVIRIFFTGYRFGVSDQVSHLPFILRLLDPTWSDTEQTQAQNGPELYEV